jgi:hypothetical protein
MDGQVEPPGHRPDGNVEDLLGDAEYPFDRRVPQPLISTSP